MGYEAPIALTSITFLVLEVVVDFLSLK